jgi:hypothetical protein
MSYYINSFQRRHKFADKIFSLYFLIMRLCATYRRANIIYLVSDESNFCEQCFRYNRFYNLAFPIHEWERFRRAKKRLSQ